MIKAEGVQYLVQCKAQALEPQLPATAWRRAAYLFLPFRIRPVILKLAGAQGALCGGGGVSDRGTAGLLGTVGWLRSLLVAQPVRALDEHFILSGPR